MQTTHQLLCLDSRSLAGLDDQSIDLVVTSPPYPMIEMWDETFAALNKGILTALLRSDCRASFELMHQELDKVWKELGRVLKTGGFACINIGDASRSLGESFQLFPNHFRILQAFWEIGFEALPMILWRKQTNAPTKFMGSGMLPAGAYVTLEHEYILLFRKGPRRVFSTSTEKRNRQESALFWEERNKWFSDLWDFKGVRQDTALFKEDPGLRRRSGAYPLMLPYRLINMYSVYGDTVLDPFLGTGTTTLAALQCGRNSVGCEIDGRFSALLEEKLSEKKLPGAMNLFQQERVQSHLQFVEQYRLNKGHPPKYMNKHYNFPVVTRQETMLKLYSVKKIQQEKDGCYRADHEVFEAEREYQGGPAIQEQDILSEGPVGRQLQIAE